MAWPCRYFETHAYRTPLEDYFRRGARWTAVPRLQLTEALYEPDHRVPKSGPPPGLPAWRRPGPQKAGSDAVESVTLAELVAAGCIPAVLVLAVFRGVLIRRLGHDGLASPQPRCRSPAPPCSGETRTTGSCSGPPSTAVPGPHPPTSPAARTTSTPLASSNTTETCTCSMGEGVSARLLRPKGTPPRRRALRVQQAASGNGAPGRPRNVSRSQRTPPCSPALRPRSPGAAAGVSP